MGGASTMRSRPDVRHHDGRYALQQGAPIDAPQVLDADEPLAVALRAGLAATLDFYRAHRDRYL